MPKTEELPAMEGPGIGTKKIKAIETAVDAWRDNVAQRMAFTKKEVETRQRVIELMHEHSVTVYPYGDDQQVVLIAGKEKVKVKAVGEDEDEDEDEE